MSETPLPERQLQERAELKKAFPNYECACERACGAHNALAAKDLLAPTLTLALLFKSCARRAH